MFGAHLRSDIVADRGQRWLDGAIARGELKPLWRKVVVQSRHMFDPWAMAEAALLASGPEAVLAGPTATFLHGLQAVTDADIHVLLPYQRQSRSRPGLVFHRGSFYADDVEVLKGLRVLTQARAVADMLCSSRPQDGLALADEALRMAGEYGEPTRKIIAAHIDRRPDPRGKARGAFILDLASPHVASIPESWVRMRLIEWGFPVPEVNWPLCDLDGRVIYKLDLAWPGLRIVLEYDGYEAHVARAVEDADRERDLRARDWIVVRAARADLGNLRRVETELRAAFKRRGHRVGPETNVRLAVVKRKTRRGET
jgi:hypothetical protein